MHIALKDMKVPKSSLLPYLHPPNKQELEWPNKHTGSGITLTERGHTHVWLSMLLQLYREINVSLNNFHRMGWGIHPET